MKELVPRKFFHNHQKFCPSKISNYTVYKNSMATKRWISRDFCYFRDLSCFHKSTILLSCTVRCKILGGEIFGEFGKFQVICQNFLVQNFLLWIIRNIREMVWMALLKYFQLKTTHKQPLPDSNGELSSKIASLGISSADACIGNYWINHYLHTKHTLDARYSWSFPDCDRPRTA